MTISGPEVGKSVRKQLLYQGLSRQPSQFTPAAPRPVWKIHGANHPDYYLGFLHDLVEHFVDFERTSRVKLCLQRVDGRNDHPLMSKAWTILSKTWNRPLNDIADRTRNPAGLPDLSRGVDPEGLRRVVPPEPHSLALIDRI